MSLVNGKGGGGGCLRDKIVILNYFPTPGFGIAMSVSLYNAKGVLKNSFIPIIFRQRKNPITMEQFFKHKFGKYRFVPMILLSLYKYTHYPEYHT